MTRIYSKIRATGAALPARRISNEQLAQQLARDGIETSDEWIRSRTGIEQRYFVQDDESLVSLSVSAAEQTLKRAQVKATDVDLIIVATTTPDRVFPSTACSVQAAIGAEKAAAFDMQVVCSGFVYALSVADAMIGSGRYQNALVIGADVMSRLMDFTDRSTCVLFGDGAGAVLLQPSNEPGLLASDLSAQGTLDASVLGCQGHLQNGRWLGAGTLTMNGQQVFRTAVSVLADSAQKALTQAGIQAQELACYVPHQANLRIMQMVAKRLGIAEDKMVVTVNQHGNTSAASVPLALDWAAQNAALKKGDAVLLQAVGAGMAWGSVILRWS